MEVRLSPADDILSMRAEIAKLKREKAKLEELLKLSEFRFITESKLNMELLDLCREYGVPVRKSFPVK